MKPVGLAVLLIAGITACCGGTDTRALDDPAAAIAEAEGHFDRWSGSFDFESYEASLREAIALWEGALDVLPESEIQTRARVLDRLAQAYFELAEGYLVESRDKEAAYEAGKDAALASLRLDPAFDETEAKSGFRAALRSANDVEAIFWYGNTLGQWLNYHKLTAIMGGVKDVAASFERSLELDETYDGAGPHRALASLIAQAHFVIGRSRDDAAFHFERCIELAPNHLEAYVSYADRYVRAVRDQDLFDRLIGAVLEMAEDPSVVGAFPFYNALAIERARRLAEDESP